MAGSVFQRTDGAQFTVDVGVTIAGGSATVAITAEEVGQAGNTAVGVQFSLASPVLGINSIAVASTEISGGADVERPELFRAGSWSGSAGRPMGETTMTMWPGRRKSLA